jgi:adenosylmethionine-8-amino-7-oxononanoate aminotransferase
MEQVDRKADHLRDRLRRIADHPHVGDLRGRGLMVGIELVRDRSMKDSFDPSDLIGKQICEDVVGRGVWVRPLGDVVILMPPLVATDAELDILADAVCEAVEHFDWSRHLSVPHAGGSCPEATVAGRGVHHDRV